ncbi:unnamed protein product [Adineta steineri]|uniref:G-protein coupled receptors family 1 profile domain-containing protein n=1 Tax=Adineta steineri TaxID=433720 RepID=A0A814TXU1_9BILA|nr:unnamed protein product [Adineta steineri]CAF1184247.1 unnamed protein product [Adineta steineri]CAF1421961.1 unnamed protein product [Adineta steineri]CAF3592390.1 unnamed protein product [Adineta steineri]
MSSYASILTQILSNITLYIDYITLIFGTIGGICNLITFTSRQMRQSAAVFYLLYGTIFQLLTILYCVSMRLFYDRSGSNLQNESSIFCKLRYYFVVTLPALASYYMFLATLDRCFCTSINVKIRAWSEIKIAKRLSICMPIVGFIISIHIFILYDIYNNLCQIKPGSIYTFIFTGYLIVIVTFLPNILMLIFSLITVSAVRNSRQRVNTTNRVNSMPNGQRPQRLELKLIKIIVIQVVLSVLLSLLRLGSYSYYIIANSISNPTINQRSAAGFAISLGGSLYFFSYAIPFYASMISTKYFRDIFYQRILLFYRRSLRQFI